MLGRSQFCGLSTPIYSHLPAIKLWIVILSAILPSPNRSRKMMSDKESCVNHIRLHDQTRPTYPLYPALSELLAGGTRAAGHCSGPNTKSC